MTLHKADVIAAVLLGLLGVYIIIQGLSYGFTAEGLPSAGFFPVLAGVLIASLSIVNVVRGLRRLEVMKGTITAQQLRPVFGISVMLVVFVVLSPWLGVTLPLPFVLVAMSYLVDPRPGLTWLAQIAGLSVLFTIGSYFLFERWLGILFPVGPFGF